MEERAKKRKASDRPDGDKEDFREADDAYNSGDEAVANDNDLAFIDTDGDDAGLLQEYNQDKQHFDDEPGERFEYVDILASPEKASNFLSSPFFHYSFESPRPKQQDLDGSGLPENHPMREALQRLSSKKKQKNASQNDQERIVQEFLMRMAEAHRLDEDILKDPGES
ncbi:MAG: hypothetical protein AAGM67_19680, partial [Bacteroidota bacterium]